MDRQHLIAWIPWMLFVGLPAVGFILGLLVGLLIWLTDHFEYEDALLPLMLLLYALVGVTGGLPIGSVFPLAGMLVSDLTARSLPTALLLTMVPITIYYLLVVAGYQVIGRYRERRDERQSEAAFVRGLWLMEAEAHMGLDEMARVRRETVNAVNEQVAQLLRERMRQ